MENLMEKLNETAAYINKCTGNLKISTGLVLGSGLGSFADTIENPVVIPYKDIPNFAQTTNASHKGQLVIGTIEGKTVMCMQGRFHFYEGWSMDEVVYPIRTMKVLGVKNLIVTNAAGCLNADWNVSDLMLISDHIKITTHESPCRGKNESELGLRFFDMSDTYCKEYRDIVKKVARNLNITLREGVYMFFAGPNFETPAEIRAARILGADAVGMSTVPEAIEAAHCGLKTIGISCLANYAAGMSGKPLSDDEVVEAGLQSKDSFIKLLRGTVKEI